jgi:hypothetical protein
MQVLMQKSRPLGAGMNDHPIDAEANLHLAKGLVTFCSAFDVWVSR